MLTLVIDPDGRRRSRRVGEALYFFGVDPNRSGERVAMPIVERRLRRRQANRADHRQMQVRKRETEH